ncbi:MAG: DUF1176 domain-containing protein [Leptolyngbyaceae cyanobacterium]
MSFDDFSTKVDRVREHLGSSERIQEALSVPHEAEKRCSYFLYQPSSLVSEVEMSRQPSEAYRRDEEGYYLLTNSVSQHLTISEAEITPLSFIRYRYNDLGDLIRYKSYLVSGRRIFEPSEEILSISSKARGMADCGSFAHYQFQGSEFQLVEYRYQECCSSERECTAQSYSRYPEKYPQIFP